MRAYLFSSRFLRYVGGLFIVLALLSAEAMAQGVTHANPRPTYSPSPKYPEEARAKDVKGRVLVDVQIDGNGNVTDAKAVSGDELLKESAVEAVRTWRFEPTLVNGEPVMVVTRVAVYIGESAPLNLAHIHLLLNHFPTVAFGIGLCMFFAALYGKNEHLRQASLVVFFLVAVVSIPTYLSGNAAEARLCPGEQCGPGISVSVIRAHEDAALFAFILMELTGFFAWLGLWQLRRVPHLPTWNNVATIVLCLLTFAAMARTASIGGEIRHPEISAVQEAVESKAGIARSIGDLVSGATGNGWLWPASETIHFIGLSLLFVPVLLVDLRILGLAKSWSFQSLYQLLPLGMFGFLLNLITGMLFFLGKPGQYLAPTFYYKILYIVLGGINVLYFMMFDEIWAVKSGDDAPLKAKLVAISAIFLWFGVLYCGHMLPFSGISF